MLQMSLLLPQAFICTHGCCTLCILFLLCKCNFLSSLCYVWSGFPTAQELSFLWRGHPDWPLDNDCCTLLCISLKVLFLSTCAPCAYSWMADCMRIRWRWAEYSPPLSREFLRGVRVAVGEFDRRVDDAEEQVFRVKTVSVHEKYHHALPMSHDIALVELDQHIQLGKFPFKWLVWSNDGEMLRLFTFYEVNDMWLLL